MPILQELELPPGVSRLWDILKVLRGICNSATNAAQVPDPIMALVGYPVWTEATKVWAQPIDPGYVTIDALNDIQVVTRYRPEWGSVVQPVPAFTVAVSANEKDGFNNVATVSAVAQIDNVPPTAGTTIHCIVGNGAQILDGAYLTVANDTPSTIATSMAAAIIAAGGAASASGVAVTLGAGWMLLAVNVGGIGQSRKEVGRIRRSIQISIWVTSPLSRYWIHDALVSTLGAIDNPWITLPDGGRVLVLPRGERFVEQSQSSYNLYEAHLTYMAEYGIVQRQNCYTIDAIESKVANQLTLQSVSEIVYQ